MMTNSEFYSIYYQYDKVVLRMEEKLLEARKRDKNRDFSEQQDVIDNLINLRQSFHKMYHLNLILERGQIEVIIEREKLLNRIKRLEKENASLKQNLTL